jgi:hypothetical protein
MTPDGPDDITARLVESGEALESAERSVEHWMVCYQSETESVRRLVAERGQLRAALREACDGWEHQYKRDPEGNPSADIERLRKIADGDA